MFSSDERTRKDLQFSKKYGRRKNDNFVTLDLSQKAEKRCPFAIFAPYLNLRLVAIKRGAKTMNRGRQQLSLAVCDAPPPLHADRGPHAFFSSCVCSSSNCGLAYAAAASTCTWQRRQKYVVARAVALWRE